MTMAPFSENPEDARPYFRRLRELRDSLQDSLGIGLPRLSMRLGTVLFGERPKVKSVRAAADDDAPSGGLDSYSGAGPTVRILD